MAAIYRMTNIYWFVARIANTHIIDHVNYYNIISSIKIELKLRILN